MVTMKVSTESFVMAALIDGYSIQEARRVIGAWLEEYNVERPHGALAGVPPARYVEKIKEKLSKAA